VDPELSFVFPLYVVFTYLLGSVPFGLLLGRWFGGIDIRQHGSGNIGATNVFRTLGTKLGLLTAVLDLGKAALAVWLGMLIIGSNPFVVAGYDIHIQCAQCLAAIMVMVGHNWSVYIGFKGGKGVACFIGGLLVINWVVALIGLTAGISVALATRYVSLGSMLASLCVFLALLVLALMALVNPLFALYGLVAAGLIIFQHRTNIARLQEGKENRLGLKPDKKK